MALLDGLSMSFTSDKRCFIQLPDFYVFRCGFLQVFWRVFRINTELYPRVLKLKINFLKQGSELLKQAVSGFFSRFLPYPLLKLYIMYSFEKWHTAILLLQCLEREESKCCIYDNRRKWRKINQRHFRKKDQNKLVGILLIF